MRLLWLLCVFAVGVASASEEEDLPLAGPCDPVACQLPDCRCSSTDIPGGLAPRDTPQFVLITFDDGVNILNIETYRDMLYNRHNSDNCPAGATFFINHEYTSYQLVNELYNNGFEIALHSVTHRTPQTYWAEATVENMRREIGDQILLMSHFANIPYDHIRGVRIPFLQQVGNASFQVMKEYGLLYDSTWATVTYLDPGLWPYTLDYASIQDCQIPPCPTASIPGPWVNPMISWLDMNGNPCGMVDACFFVPDLNDENGWYNFIVTNFERHYLGNRSPFGFYVHEWYVRAYPAVGRALVRFMDQINLMQDVFMVNAGDVIDWVRNPVPINEYKEQPCRVVEQAPCAAVNCGPLYSDHSEMGYWMSICTTCPNSYPWYGNPLGN